MKTNLVWLGSFWITTASIAGSGLQATQSEPVVPLVLQAVASVAAAGDPVAQTQLGLAYANGDGVLTNLTQAVKWFCTAANQNYAPAQYNLAICCLNGRGVQKDVKAAVALIRMAAEQGLAEAQASLGDCYATGNGVAKDWDEAFQWRTRALAQKEVAQSSVRRVSSSGEIPSSTIVTVYGRKYEDVVVIGETPAYLIIKHTLPNGSTGVAQLPFEDLSPDWRQRYGYSREAGIAYDASHRQALAQQQEAIAQQEAIRRAVNFGRMQATAEAEAAQAKAEGEAQARAEVQAAQARAQAQQEWQMQQLNSNLRNIADNLERLDWDVQMQPMIEEGFRQDNTSKLIWPR